MKKSLLAVFVLLVAGLGLWYGLGSATADPASQIQSDPASKIDFFYQDGCPHCTDAETWISQNYPNLKMNMLNLRQGDSITKLVKAAARYGISLNNVGTPLIGFGDNYIMGWGDESTKLFPKYLKEINNK